MKNRLITMCALPLLLTGCKSAAPAAPSSASPASAPAATYPARPTTAPAAFKIFHHGNSSFTLTVNEKATDDQLSSLVWQLRDAARTHTFDSIHIPQKQVDADGKTVWFHIYRGAKCAPEKYAPGNPPCGGSYHAAADYTFDTHSTPPWDKGVIYHSADDPHQTQLWDSEAPYTPAPAPKSVSEVLNHLDEDGSNQISVKGHFWWGKEGSFVRDDDDKRILLVGYSQRFNDTHTYASTFGPDSGHKSDIATLTGHLQQENGKRYLIIDQIAFAD